MPVDKMEVIYHYTDNNGFLLITRNRTLRVSNNESRSDFGVGAYCRSKAPHEWPNRQQILVNNYRPHQKDIDQCRVDCQRSENMVASRFCGRADYRVASIVSKEHRYDIHEELDAQEKRFHKAYFVSKDNANPTWMKLYLKESADQEALREEQGLNAEDMARVLDDQDHLGEILAQAFWTVRGARAMPIDDAADGLGVANQQKEDYAHRDIKPANCVTLKLCDLGVARAAGQPGNDRTPAYNAPETQNPTYVSSSSRDVYGMGAVAVNYLLAKGDAADPVTRKTHQQMSEAWPNFQVNMADDAEHAKHFMWMFADFGWRQGLAKKDPVRWSNAMLFDHLLQDIPEEELRKRTVLVRRLRQSQSFRDYGDEQVFKDKDAIIAHFGTNQFVPLGRSKSAMCEEDLHHFAAACSAKTYDDPQPKWAFRPTHGCGVCGVPLNEKNTAIFVVFRDTATVFDCTADLRCKIKDGLKLKPYGIGVQDNFWSEIEDSRDEIYEKIITGHSYGGGCAMMLHALEYHKLQQREWVFAGNHDERVQGVRVWRKPTFKLGEEEVRKANAMEACKQLPTTDAKRELLGHVLQPPAGMCKGGDTICIRLNNLHEEMLEYFALKFEQKEIIQVGFCSERPRRGSRHGWVDGNLVRVDAQLGLIDISLESPQHDCKGEHCCGEKVTVVVHSDHGPIPLIQKFTFVGCAELLEDDANNDLYSDDSSAISDDDTDLSDYATTCDSDDSLDYVSTSDEDN